MAIYRGPGGSGDATNDATSQSIIAIQAAIEAAESAIQAAASAVSASNSATAASNSASAASTSATNASNFADDAADYATAAASALDEFTDLYLGAKTTNPSLDNDGNALQTGALYFNTVANEFRVYTGIEWQVITVGAVGDSVITQRFSGDGNTVAFTLSTEPFSENSTFVYINGAYQQKNTYNVSGLTLTFSEAPPSGTDNIEVLTITMVDIDNITASIINIADAGGYYASSKVEGALQEAATFTQSGTGAVLRTKTDKLKETVSVKDFGAVGDGVTDDTAAIQAAIDSGAKRILVTSGSTYKTTDEINVGADQELVIETGSEIYLDTTNADLRAVKLSGANAKLSGGGKVSTSLRTLKFLVDLTGDYSSADGMIIYYVTKSTIAPIGGTDIPYNRGGVAVYGDNCTVKNCEIYNQEGAGIVVYENQAMISDNIIHDNVLGMHLQDSFTTATQLQVQVLNNRIYDNNVNHAQGADGILGGAKFQAVISNNYISNNGEHGTYIYCKNSVISNNVVINNYQNGIKIRNQVGTVVSDNTVRGNNTSGTTGASEIYFQVNATGCDDVLISNNNVFSISGEGGIRVVFINNTYSCSRLSVIGNTARNSTGVAIDIAFTEDCVVSNNICYGDLHIGSGQSGAPTVQYRANVSGNYVSGTLDAGRCNVSDFVNNNITNYSIGAGQYSNRIIGNNIRAQTDNIDRRHFIDFSNNNIDASGVTGAFFKQGASTSENSSKLITMNRIIGNGTRLIDDSTSAISGNDNVIVGNIVNNSADIVSMWGDGHTVTANVNTGAGGTGFCGFNNSYAVANNPILTLRAGTTGNVVL